MSACSPWLERRAAVLPARRGQRAQRLRASRSRWAPARVGLDCSDQTVVAVVSPDPTTKPLIVHNYLAESEDMRSAIAGIRAVLEIAGAQPLARHTRVAHTVPASDSDADLEAQIRHTDHVRL